MRPVLRPGAHLLRRADGLQVGLDPVRAVLLPRTGAATDVVRLLNGTVAQDRFEDPVLRLLEGEGLLMDERTLRRRTGEGSPAGGHAALARVHGDAAADALASRARHRITCCTFGHPAGRDLGPRLRALLAAAELPVELPVADQSVGPGLVGALVGVGEPDRTLVEGWVRDGVPHLLVRVVEGVVRIGPLVVPGVTACLRCVDLHCADADPAWPLLLAQYTSASACDRADGAPEPVDPLLAALGVAWAARDLATYVDGGRPTSWSATVTLAADLATLEARTWLRHPACGCGWA